MNHNVFSGPTSVNESSVVHCGRMLTSYMHRALAGIDFQVPSHMQDWVTGQLLFVALWTWVLLHGYEPGRGFATHRQIQISPQSWFCGSISSIRHKWSNKYIFFSSSALFQKTHWYISVLYMLWNDIHHTFCYHSWFTGRPANLL